VTPLGRAKTDGEVVRALARAGGAAVSPDDFAHRKEHSIEFQVMFLQHVLRCPDITIVPILCGSFQNFFERYNRAAEIPGVGSLLSQLREIVLDSRRKTLLVAGVDLSHVGPKFGDRFSATGYEPEVRQHDRFLLDALCEQQVEAFWEEERRTDARYRVCGFSALACLLELLPPGRGEVLGYEFWNEQATQSGVSFAAVAFRPHETE
jgi:AmmeMemoRadiSam system protein B